MRNLLSIPLLIVAAVPLVAQTDDPPARVARVNYLMGSVSFRPGSVDDWTAATLNYPLTTGDHLWADADGRAEIHAGSTAIRMGPRTAMSVLNLDDRTVQLSLTDGSLHIRVRELAEDESFEVDTPNVAITLLRPGEYRIDADGDTNTAAVTVRSGSAEVTGGGVGFAVRPRQTGKATGMDTIAQDVGPALPEGEFDNWCQMRDRAEDAASASEQYVPRDMVGYEDLDRNGAWSDTPDWGPVWRPTTVSIDWAPYRYGHWVWVQPWGWTWIDDAPWGFAPFHYGRWVMWRGSWVWVPGHRVAGVRPVYSPALVVFIGTPGFSGAAWFPLGPREVYRPTYRVSDIYLRRVNVMHATNVTVVNNVYINQRAHGAVTVVSRETFIGARPVGREVVRYDDRQFGRATVIGSAPPMAPERVSVIGRIGPAPMRPPVRIVDRTVVVRHAPPPPPARFDAIRPEIERNQGRPLDRGEMDRFRGQQTTNPHVRMAPAPGPAGVPARPAVMPREERGPMRRPEQPQQPNIQPGPPAITQPRPREDRPVFTPGRPSAPPQQPVNPPAPREARPAPQPEQPSAPAPSERPRFDRPQRQENPQPRAERPAPQERREVRPEPRNEQRPERNVKREDRRPNRREEKKDK